MQVRPSAVAAALLPIGACLAIDPAGWSPFGPAKWLVVSVVTLAVIASACGRTRLRVAPALTAAWGALVVVMAFAALGGLDPLYAWIGTPERHLGVFGWLVIGAAFVAGQQLRWSDRSVVAAGVVGAGWVVAAYAVVEAAWRAPIRLDTTSDRLGGPFGSPAFLGAACALLVPATIGSALDPGLPRWLRRAAIPAAAGCTVALVGSAARAAWLGTAAAALAVVAARRVRSRVSGDAAERDGDARRGGSAGPALAERDGVGGSATVALSVARPERRVDRRHLVALVATGTVTLGLCVLLLGGQLGSALERTHGASSRLDEWRVAVRVVAERPVLGTGPEGYRLAAPANVSAAYERAYGREVIPDRAHSGILDVTASGGLLAGAAYVLLLGLAGLALWRAMRAAAPLVVGLAAGGGAYLAQQQLLFPLAELDPVAWLLVGAVIAWTPAVAAGSGATGATVAVDPDTAGRRPAPRWQLLVGAVAALAGVGSLVLGVLDVAADRLDKRALDAIADGRPADAVDLAERAVGLRPDVVRYQLVLGRAERADGTLAGVDRWLDAVDDALDLSPLDPLVRQERGVALNRRAAITGTDADVGAALAYWRLLVGDDANNARWQLELGRAAAAADDVALARAAWTRAADLAPSDPTPGALLAALPPA